ncbi:MAG: hypothetical protein ACO3A2_04355 [Bdellovibrionia bacterium]
MRSNKRKKILINPKFQSTFTGFILTLALINVIVFFLNNWVFFKRLRHMGERFGIPPQSAFFSLLNDQQSLMNEVFFFTSVINLIIIGSLGLIFSHKISGPIHRLEKQILGLNPEHLEPLKTRRGDYFPELITAVNSLIRKLKKKHENGAE